MLLSSTSPEVYPWTEPVGMGTGTGTGTENCSLPGRAIYARCDCALPMILCAAANISGYFSSVEWFLVLIPQVIYNFHRQSVAGISTTFAILNFTASLNDAFFVFKMPNMPWFTYGGAVYMPTLNGILLMQIFYYTKPSCEKAIATAVCAIVWGAIVGIQLVFNFYSELEWISIVFWSSQTFPQVFLNMKRRSTHGLAHLSLAITAVGKITDFAENYLLVMPLQYVVMIYFSSTVSQVGTIQVLWYWNQRPLARPDGSEDRCVLVKQDTSEGCNCLRALGMLFFGALLAVYATALWLRTNWWIASLMNLTVYGILLGCYVQVERSMKKETRRGSAGPEAERKLEDVEQ